MSISRGSENCRVYTDDKEMLKEAVSRPGDRLSAIEISQTKEREGIKKQIERTEIERLTRNQYERSLEAVNENALFESERSKEFDQRLGRSGFEPER